MSITTIAVRDASSLSWTCSLPRRAMIVSIVSG